MAPSDQHPAGVAPRLRPSSRVGVPSASARGDLVLVVVGAGGSYTPELISGLATGPGSNLPIGQIRMVDLNRERLEIMCGLAERMLAACNREIEVNASTDLSQSLPGADFVVTQIRVGGMAARHLDESIPLRYGVIGQETTGPGGMFKALRTVPVMVEIASEVARLAPAATILNYTNPSGVITQAVLNYTSAQLVGLCSGIPSLQTMLAGVLSDLFGPIETRCVGLNHVGFVHSVQSGGRDITVEAIEEVARQLAQSSESLDRWCRLSRVLGAFPIPGYCDYYFRRSLAVAKQRRADKTRAQQIMEIEAEIFQEAADLASVSVPAALTKRGGQGYSSITFGVLGAMVLDEPAELVMSVLNRGSVEGLPDDASVEVVCRVDGTGATPLPVGEMPLAFRGLVQAVKAHETLTIQAALTRRRDLALQALVAHPLVGDLDIAEPMLDELLEAHGLAYS
jgi:6-phospho-beta-glucosidase